LIAASQVQWPNYRVSSSALAGARGPVIGIHAVDLLLGFSTLHCLTQQPPAASA
jgi:agmatine/peptidylarginine deiminase